MHLRNTVSKYGFIAAALHWLIVVGIIAQYLLAEAGEDGEEGSAAAIEPMNIHNSLGITLLGLAVLRLLWRLLERTPKLPVHMRRYEVVLARAVHAAFYALLFAIPLSGWMITSLEGETLRYFGLFDLPALTSTGTESAEKLAEEVHEILFNVLVALALVHVIAALKHHFVDRDGVLRSMLPGREWD